MFITAPALVTDFPASPIRALYLPAHTTFDLSLGKDFGERFSASVNALNVANRRVELRQQPNLRRLSLEQPKRDLLEVRYRFHY